MTSSVARTTFERMERMYAPQQRIYDLTRAWYLLGRDRLLRQIKPEPGAVILDIGCGTGRNLQRLAQLYPQAQYVGLDPSASMLMTARRKLDGVDVNLVQGVAEDMPVMVKNGDLPRPQHILFSYSLSIMPMPTTAIEAGLDILADNGQLHIVDFGPMDGLPGIFANAMRAWLRNFDVAYRPEVGIYLSTKMPKARIRRPFRGYSELINAQKS